MNGFTQNRTFYVLAAITALLCLISISYRYRVEQENRTASLCMDIQGLHDLGASTGRTPAEVLSQLKAAGLTAVTMSADPISDLLQRKELVYEGSPAPILIANNPEATERVKFALTARFGDGPWQSAKSGPTGTAIIPVGTIPFDSMMSVSLGLSPADARLARAAGVQVIARHGNPNGATPRYIAAMLGRSKKLGATVYLAEGDQVMGQRELLEDTATVLEENNLLYASPEFAKLGGDAALAEKCQDRLVRLHSVQQAEVDKMGPADLVERFEKAYRERNIRILLLRPVSYASADPVTGATKLIADVAAAIKRDGGKLGAPVPYRSPDVPKPLFLLIGLAAGACIVWVGCALVSSRTWRMVGTVAIFALAGACWMKSGREFMALAAAMALPIGAYLTLDLQRIRPVPDFARLSAISLVGGLCVAGLLNDLPYLIRVDQFPGVKAAHFLPIVIIGLVLIGRQFDWRQASKSPATWGSAAIGLMLLAAMAFMLARTGNDNPAAVSSLELKFRDLLDSFLYTRPRTKEFLMGHPALIVGLGMLMLAKPDDSGKNPLAAWGALLITFGAIGQTSIVNTLCHLHTPVVLSLARILIGWVIGGILGGLLWAFFRAKWPAKQV